MGASVSCGQDTLAAESLFPLASTLSLPLFSCPARPLVLTQGSLCVVSRTETRGERSEAAVWFFSVHTHRCGTWQRSVDIIVCTCQMLGTFMYNGDKTAVLRRWSDEWSILNPDWQAGISTTLCFCVWKWKHYRSLYFLSPWNQPGPQCWYLRVNVVALRSAGFEDH